VIILGIVLLIVGYWLIPDALPQVPAQLDRLVIDFGILFLVIGVIFLILSLVGHPIGNRRYWY